ncbi:MAG: polyamine ABC transporter substrate-binding protein [Alphaproteobacteria bacterium]|nr:polyamine ABC transporter substrate-binding protein [Alphaproteobacteria bacterium]
MINLIKSGLSIILATLLINQSVSAQEKVVNVYNWSDYIGEDTVEKFTKATGIKVVYDVYDSNETLEAKLMTGKSGYDIVVPSGAYLGRQIKAGAYQKLDKSLLSNLANQDPKIMKANEAFDPNNEYAVPYFWGTTGIGYNVDKIKKLVPDAPLNSLDMIFKPELASKLASCGIAMLDAPGEILQIALNYLGKDPHSEKAEDYKEAEKLLLGVRPYIKYFHSSRYIEDLANGEICLVLGFSGDIFIAGARASEAKNGNVIEYAIPKEGTLLWVDSMAIPKDAPHPKEAHAFIDFVMDGKVAAAGTNFVRYATASKAALPFIDKDIKNNTSIYPTEEVMKRLFDDKAGAIALERLRTRTWTKIKTESGKN